MSERTRLTRSSGQLQESAMGLFCVVQGTRLLVGRGNAEFLSGGNR